MDLVSIEKIHQISNTKAVFDHSPNTSKLVKNTPLGVWEYFQTRSFVSDILLEAIEFRISILKRRSSV